VKDIIQINETNNILMLIYDDRICDLHYYNTPTTADVTAIMISDSYDLNLSNRNILLRLHDEGLQRIFKLHPLYDPLHYVLLFPKMMMVSI